jgi:hypothetical protein
VVAFSGWAFGEHDHLNTTNYNAPELFDWDKITTYAPFDNLMKDPDPKRWPENGSMYADLFCKAHEHKARILSWGYVASSFW